MYTLISFATQWGSKYGGINSFNTDFLVAFGVAYSHSAQVICIVASATDEEKAEARNSGVYLVSLPYKPVGNELGEAQVEIGIVELSKNEISFEPDNTIWLGHDRITGAAAIAAAKSAGGRSAVIHHMSYSDYEAFAENSQSAYDKVQIQQALLRQADLVLAVGPLLRDAASDRLGAEKMIHMLIPGLAEIKVREAPKTFTVFMSGRLCKDSARIKQGHLGIAAFAKAHCDARDNGMPEGLCRQPKLVLRGVDFEAERTSAPEADTETELKKFAEEYANCVINLHALPFTQIRDMLYEDLSAASVALMPSWHEGFGLVAWEAIAAGVPLIVSKNSGVYQLLKENHPGAGPGCVYPVDVRGAVTEPFFHEKDVQAVVDALKSIALNPGEARRKAVTLRNMLGEYSWSACVKEAMKSFDWPLHQGIIHSSSPEVEPIIPQPFQRETAPIPDSPLHIPSKQWKRGSGLADSMMLRAEEEVVGFDLARQPEIDLLNDWLDEPQWPQAVRLVAGPGGAGKTRLALELCRQRATAGWSTGFLDTNLDMSSTWQILKNCHKPLLIVIDYAETRQTALLAFINAMMKTPGDQPVRLLLLARAAGEWWENLPSKDSFCEALLNGYATSLFNLPALHPDTQGRLFAYQQALMSFAQALDVAVPDISPDLASEHFERPLYIQMAALLALHGERPTTAEGLTRALLHHERRYWRGLLTPYGWAEPESLAQQLLALATLAGVLATPKEARIYWTAAGLATLGGSDFSILFSTLAPLYPSKQGLQAIRPDLLGEALVAQTLLLPECSQFLNAVLSKNAGQIIRRHAMTVLARLSGYRVEVHETLINVLVNHFPDCCKDLIAVAAETPSVLPVLAETAFTLLPQAVKSQVAGLLQSIVAKESLQLAGLSCLIAEYLAEKARQRWEKKSSNLACMSEYARALSNYSVSLSVAGLNERALSCSHDAVSLFTQLVNRDRKSFEAMFAATLNNYSSHLHDNGKDEEALTYALQALEICKRLAQKNPDRYDSDHARTLNNYANRLSDNGKNDESLLFALEALEIRQKLAQKNPDRYDSDHAKSVASYANFLRDNGKDEEALKYALQALEIYQRLARKSPDQYDHGLAMALNNYASNLNPAGKDEEALKYALQALEIYQRLALKNPDRYDPNLATSLGNYSSHLNDAGKNEEALKYGLQALEIYQRLAQKNPDRYYPNLAMSLNNYASHLSDIGKDEEAHMYVLQSLEIYQRLALKNPDRYDRDLAVALNNYASHLSDNGKNEEAHMFALQSLEIYQRLALKNPARFAADMFSTASSVSFFNWLLGGLDNGEELTNLDLLPSTVVLHRRLILEFYAAFARGCWSTDQTSRLAAFRKVLLIWNDLTIAAKKDARPYWLCAAAWFSTFAPEAVEGSDWQVTWQNYGLQRQGQIPKWLYEVSHRLGFEWPELKPLSTDL